MSIMFSLIDVSLSFPYLEAKQKYTNLMEEIKNISQKVHRGLKSELLDGDCGLIVLMDM
jgi:hypothetical protein